MISIDQKFDQPKEKLVWMSVLIFLTLLMIALGGVTRLTGSGLSMVDWQIVRGIIPPLNASNWEELFAAYRQFPEFQQINYLINLAEFKKIFYFEYAHRLLGRLIGMTTLLPIIYFGWKRNLTRQEKTLFATLFLLVVLQGLAGWYMVQSGLINRPEVSHYRLAVHFALAILFLGLTTFLALKYLSFPSPQELLQNRAIFLKTKKIFHPCFINLVALLLIIQLFYGTLTAGLKAGLVSTTYPKILGEWVPFQLFQTDQFNQLIFENPYFVNFFHRHLGVIVAILLLILSGGVVSTFQKDLKNIALIMMVLALLQPILGILSLIYSVPVALASLHQVVAVLIFQCLFFIKWRFRFFNPSKIPVSDLL